MGSDIEHDEMLGAGEWDADEIARCALAAYRAQPARGKPGNSTSTPSEHTVLAAFVLFTPSSCPATDTAARRYRCLSFATGTSALPRKALDLACGDVLHDSHAEVLARRALLRWLYLQLLTRSHLGTSDYGSELEGGEEGKRPEPLLERSEQQGQGAKWTLRNGCKLILYTSTIPCGDASMLYLELAAAKEAKAHSSDTASDDDDVAAARAPAMPAQTQAAAYGLLTSRTECAPPTGDTANESPDSMAAPGRVY